MLTHKTTCRVIYGDTDKMGFVYHANYFRWFEAGRSDLFRQLGISYKEIEAEGIHLPVAEVHCRFISSSQYDDILVIETTLDTSFKAGMKFDYRVFSEDGDKILAKGYTKHACMDRNGQLVRPPELITKLIENNSRKGES
jgi:acyl-CoA thioester hydrolase